MTKQTLFLSIILIFSFTHHCSAMETQQNDKIIAFEQGLLTIIPGKIIKHGYKCDWWGNQKSIYTFGERNDALINLLHYEKHIHEPQYSKEYFLPLLIKLSIKQPNTYIEQLGPFYNKTHREAKEAI